jgi:hypothetical protein
MYTTTAVVIYIFGGQNITSPALDSARGKLRTAAWVVALGTIIIAGVINGHIAIKYLYVRMFRNSKEDVIHQKTKKAWGWWLGIGAGFWFLAFLLAEAVPVFKDMVSLSGALFASWFTFGLPGMFWCHMNFKTVRVGYGIRFVAKCKWKWKKTVLLAVNLMFIAVGIFAVSWIFSVGSEFELTD